MPETRLHTCMLCEAVCGIEVDVEGNRAVAVRGDSKDPFSKGHICPKAYALVDLHDDPDRVRTPLRRQGNGFVPVSWESAMDEATTRLAEIQRAHGKSAVAIYVGNPTVHSYSALFAFALFSKALGSRARFSATSVDQLPHMLASLQMFGHQLALPVPDLDRTGFFLVLGANPVVSNGSLMTAGNAKKRIQGIQARGGKVVVIDPRRTETADIADAHHFIAPGTDVYFLLAILQVVFEEGLVRTRGALTFAEGLDAVRALVRPFTPERVADKVGITADAIRGIAREFARADAAAAYGRVGVCTQEHGGLAAWLVVVLNAVTGNLDHPGGVMFPTPAVDLARIMAKVGERGHFGVWKSRVRGLPEFGGELPAATMAEELETPGEGRARALVTFAGNPVLSTPNGARLARALSNLDFMVSIDIYRNETTRHANLILPTSFGLERDHYDIAFYALAVRNAARYAKPALTAPAGVRHDWEVLTDLAIGLRKKGMGKRKPGVDFALRALRAAGPRRTLDFMLRTGPHGALTKHRLSVRKLEALAHGVDLGPLEPHLAKLLGTASKRVELAPEVFTREIPRLARDLDAHAMERAKTAADRTERRRLVLIGRRQLRSNNSWMHNSLRLVKGPVRCTLLMHPEDAKARGLTNGARVRVTSLRGTVEAPLEVSDAIARGVVSLPHGWGHGKEGVELRVAAAHPGASINDLTDEAAVDPVSGVASFSGVPVEVDAAPAAE